MQPQRRRDGTVAAEPSASGNTRFGNSIKLAELIVEASHIRVTDRMNAATSSSSTVDPSWPHHDGAPRLLLAPIQPGCATVLPSESSTLSDVASVTASLTPSSCLPVASSRSAASRGRGGVIGSHDVGSSDFSEASPPATATGSVWPWPLADGSSNADTVRVSDSLRLREGERAATDLQV